MPARIPVLQVVVLIWSSATIATIHIRPAMAVGTITSIECVEAQWRCEVTLGPPIVSTWPAFVPALIDVWVIFIDWRICLWRLVNIAPIPVVEALTPHIEWLSAVVIVLVVVACRVRPIVVEEVCVVGVPIVVEVRAAAHGRGRIAVSLVGGLDVVSVYFRGIQLQ